MSQEISTQQIGAMLHMYGSQLSLIINNPTNDFPKFVRVGGVTGTTKFYDKTEVEIWVLAHKEKKAKRKPTKLLIKQFLGGKFDREDLKNKYSSLAITSKKNKPQTKKIHVKDSCDKIPWPKNSWKGLI